MSNKASILNSLQYRIRTKWRNPRVIIVFLLLLAYQNMLFEPIRSFCSTTQLRIEPWLFSFVLSDPYSIFIISLGLILLFCDIPSIDTSIANILLREGRNKWLLGNVMYIVVVTVVYFSVQSLSPFLLLWNHLEISGDWGRVINTFAQTSLDTNYGIVIPFNYRIVLQFNVIEAFFLQLLICILIGTLLGLLIFFINFCLQTTLGSFIASILAIFPLFIRKSDWMLHYLSPVSWMSFSVIDIQAKSSFPSLSYALVVSIFLISALLIALSRRTKRTDF